VGWPPNILKAGDTYYIEALRAHDAKNAGTSPAKVLAVYIVETGYPFATLVK
jgi:quercetin dioxygenase-like cupin family protein